ncbi:hypothetical protein FHY03_003665 [Sphingomonas sp. BK345]|nr:hypothetical protein [Sphingomonas sp. BK345]
MPFRPGALPWPTSGVAALVDHARPSGDVHDRASRAVLLHRIAALLDQPLLPPMDAAAAASTTAMLVPGDALVEEDATAAGIFDRGDILGGVVPAFFVGTKAISHGLVGAHAARPRDWSEEMAHRLGDAALLGYTAFSRADAAEAGRRLLRDGPVRIKDVCGKAGLGQEVVRDAAALPRWRSRVRVSWRTAASCLSRTSPTWSPTASAWSSLAARRSAIGAART